MKNPGEAITNDKVPDTVPAVQAGVDQRIIHLRGIFLGEDADPRVNVPSSSEYFRFLTDIEDAERALHGVPTMLGNLSVGSAAEVTA